MSTTRIEASVEVEAPASTAYNVWSQFDLFPKFMPDVEAVERTDDRHLLWRTRIWGQQEEWTAKITEQIPDKRIAWRSERGPFNAGVVTFHRLSDEHARVMLQMEYEPQGLAERAAAAIGIIRRRVNQDLASYKKFAEEHGHEVPGRREPIPAKPDAAQHTPPTGDRHEHADDR